MVLFLRLVEIRNKVQVSVLAPKFMLVSVGGEVQRIISDNKYACVHSASILVVVMPMLNPDGVAIGNSRVNLAGYDLNRCWEKPPDGTEVAASRRVIEECCSSPGGVFAYLDFHAHSRRHGVFTLSNPATQPAYMSRQAKGHSWSRKGEQSQRMAPAVWRTDWRRFRFASLDVNHEVLTQASDKL